MSNTISILLAAKDEASSTIGKLTSNIATGVGNMAKKVQEGLTKASVAMGAIGVGLTAYAKSSTDYTQKLVSDAKALQRQTGATIEDSSKLLYVIQRMGGSADSAGAVFNIFAKRIKETRDQSADAALTQETLRNKIEAAKIQVTALTKEQAKNGDASGALRNKIDGLNLTIQGYQKSLHDAASPLDQLGVATQNADKSNRSFNDILLDVSDKFKKMPDGVEKTNYALALFGRSGTDMIKTLNLGRDGIVALETKAEQLGLTLTDKTVGAITKYIESQKELQDSTNGLKVQVGTLTAPVLTNFNNTLTSMATEALKTNSPLRNLVANVAAFGGPVATAASALLGFMANIFTINKGLGITLTAVLGVATAITAGGGLLFALGSVVGLDFGPFGKAAHDTFGALIDWINRSIKGLGSLTSSPEWQGIKKASQDALGFATGLLQAFTKALNDGTVTRVLTDLAQRFTDVATSVGSYLGPKLSNLWTSLTTNLVPALLQLWHQVLEPLIPVVGVLFVTAVGTAINIITWLTSVFAGLINFLLANGNFLAPIIGAFVALKAAMALQAAFTALTAGFTALTTVTIPAAAARFGVFKALVQTPMVMPAIVIGAAIASLAAIIAKAQEANDAITGASDALNNLDSTLKSSKEVYTRLYKEGKISAEDYKNKINGINDDIASNAAKRKEQIYTGFFGPLLQSFSNVSNYMKTGSLKAAPSHFASGTSYAPGGMALVGEDGPEIVNLPRGSQVMTAPQTQKMIGGGGFTINGGLHIHNNMDEQRFLKGIAWRLSL